MFVDELPLGQICPVCLLAMRNPVQTVCGHRFCESCLSESFRYFMFNMFCLCKLHISANKRSIQNCSHTYESRAQCGLERYIEYTSDARHISHQLIFDSHSFRGDHDHAICPEDRNPLTLDGSVSLLKTANSVLCVLIINIKNRPRLSLFCSIYNICLLV